MSDKKSEKNVESRCRVWSFIAWQESIHDGWIDYIRSLHVPGAISPLHDKDTHKDDDGDHKKPHWHVILNFDGVKSYDQIKSITDHIGAGFPVRVHDIGGLTRYLIHLDDPDKYPYDRSKIISLSGYDVDFYFDLPKSKITAMLREIGLYIVDHNIMEFCDLVEFSLMFNPDWYYIISQVSTKFVVSFINSRRHKYMNLKVDEDGVVCGS